MPPATLRLPGRPARRARAPVELARGAEREPRVGAPDDAHVHGRAGGARERGSHLRRVALRRAARERRHHEHARRALAHGHEAVALGRHDPGGERLPQRLDRAGVHAPYLPTPSALDDDGRRADLDAAAVHVAQRLAQRGHALQGEVAAHEAEPEHVVGEGDDSEVLERHLGQGDAQGLVLPRPRGAHVPRPRQAARAAR